MAFLANGHWIREREVQREVEGSRAERCCVTHFNNFSFDSIPTTDCFAPATIRQPNMSRPVPTHFNSNEITL